MINHKENKDIDRKKWDACIKASQSRNIFVNSFYLDIVCEDWSALIQNDYEAVFPIASGSKYRIRYIYQPFFTRYFGVYSASGISEELVNAFFEAIPSKYKHVEFCLHEQHPFPVNGFEKKDRKYQYLSFDNSYESLYRNYSDNAKRRIKKAVKSECEVKEGIAPSEIVALFRRTKGQELEVFKEKDYRNLVRLMDACVARKTGESIAVYSRDGKLGAAGFFMFYDNRYVFLKSGVTEYGKDHGFMHLLFDSFIKKHAATESVLDFGGSSVESVARFYKNFGAKDCVYLQVKRNHLPKLVNWLKSLKK
jgi:hypothetical protein